MPTGTNSRDEMRAARARVSTLDDQVAAAREAADAYAGELNAAGKTMGSLSANEGATLKRLSQRVDDLGEQRKAASDRAHALLENAIPSTAAFGGRAATRFDDGAVLGRAPWGLTRAGLDAMYTDWRAGHSARTGLSARVDNFRADVGFDDPITIEHSSTVELLGQEPVRIANYIPIRMTNYTRVEYIQQVGRADAAAAVARGAAKPESSPSFERKFADVVKVAHFGSIDDEVIKDEGDWRELVGGAYLRGLLSEENRQLLTANGSGDDMTGLMETADAYVIHRELTTPELRLEAIHRGITRLRTGDAKVDPTAIVMHPNDYEKALFEKASGSGEYLAGDPLEMDTPTFWNVPVLVTTDMTEFTVLVANLPVAARIHWREMPVFQVHPYGGGLDEWKENRTLVRAEERLVLTVHHPEALVHVTLA